MKHRGEIINPYSAKIIAICLVNVMAKLQIKSDPTKCIICGKDLEKGKLGYVCNACSDRMISPEKFKQIKGKGQTVPYRN